MVPLNKLYFGDNLEVLRRYVKDETVDLVYLDPPFNSRADYNILFKEKSGEQSASQITAFEDTWEWNAESKHSYDLLVQRGDRVSDVMRAFHTFLGGSDMMAYLAMMAPRLVELHRVLKLTGSMYLHCDPTASHYLKLLMDAVFGPENFINEIIWKRTNARSTDGKWPRIHDVILFFVKGDAFRFNSLKVPADKAKLPHTLITGPDGLKYQTYELTAPGLTKDGMSGQPWRGFDVAALGRHWANSHAVMDDWDREGLIHWAKDRGFPRRRDSSPFDPSSRMTTVSDVWTDIDRINQAAAERLGYPTQKPEALLERIIKASSTEGNVVLDPFCGCGTAIAAAQKLNRQWIGIDITHLAIGLIKGRLDDAFGRDVRKIYEVIGEPTDLASARVLAEQDRFQFQAWALGLVHARTATSAKRGADRGIDGKLFFRDGLTDLRQVILSVKSGNVKAEYVRDLVGTVEREKADMGVLITLETPTKPMLREALEAGFFKSPHFSDEVPKIQILTIEQLLTGAHIEIPHLQLETFKQAPKAKAKAAQNMNLSFGEAEPVQ